MKEKQMDGGTRVSLYLTDRDITWLKEARDEDESVSHFIRRILKEYKKMKEESK